MKYTSEAESDSYPAQWVSLDQLIEDGLDFTECQDELDCLHHQTHAELTVADADEYTSWGYDGDGVFRAIKVWP